MPTITELSEQRKTLHEEMKGILDKAESEKRGLTAEERQEYDRLEADLDSLGEQIAGIQGDADRRRRHAETAAELSRSRGRATDHTASAAGGDGASLGDFNVSAEIQRLTQVEGMDRRQAIAAVAKQTAGSPRLKALSKFVSHGFGGLNPSEQGHLQVDNDTAGGTMVLPEEFVAQLIQRVDDMLHLRRISTVLPLTNAESVGVPSLENDPADADWTSEVAIGGTDADMSTGKRKLHPHPLGKLLKASKTLLRKSVIPADSLIRDRLSYKFAVTEEKAFLAGMGANQPLGVFTASAQGISTSRDVSDGNTATAVTADGLINAKFALKSQYMASANTRWVFHRTVVRDIRKLKDGNGQYLWVAGLAGTPDTILEVPYLMSEFAPNTMTTGLYVGIIGDFTFYWIAESLRMELQRLDELYAATNQVGFIGRMELDAMPVLEEPFARVKLA